LEKEETPEVVVVVEWGGALVWQHILTAAVVFRSMMRWAFLVVVVVVALDGTGS
jgi:hypothetical protein